jgi:hypothetical protein
MATPAADDVTSATRPIPARTSGGRRGVDGQVGGRASEPQVDVLRRAGALQPELDDQSALQQDGIAHHLSDPCEESIEDEQLPPPGEVDARARRGPKALFERLLEGSRRRVGS